MGKAAVDIDATEPPETVSKYPGLLSQEEILDLLQSGVYSACPETGTVRNRRGRVITPFTDDYGRRFVRLYYRRKRKAIVVSRLVWMSVAGCVIPDGFEVHHRDHEVTNDVWRNLILLHRLDHRKLHEDDEDDEIPF